MRNYIDKISDLIFKLAIIMLPFENWFFAPSNGWATITPIILVLYLIINMKLCISIIIKYRKIIYLIVIGLIISIINYFFCGFNLENSINTIISLGLGLVVFYSFSIYYKKNNSINKIIKFLVISYFISLLVGIIQFFTIKLNIEVFYDFFNVIFKRNYLNLNRIQFLFTEPSFIGMHIFGILLPLYMLSKDRKIAILSVLFIICAITFGSGVRILLDTVIVIGILLCWYMIEKRKYKLLLTMPIVLIVVLTTFYNTNYRVREIFNKGIYADGSLATRYFRIQSTIYGYTKSPIHLIFGYGMGNSKIPMKDGYDKAILTYKSSYVDEVIGLGNENFNDDSVSYCLFTRIVSEYGLIMFSILIVSILKLVKRSTWKYRYLYLIILGYLYIQFESFAFYTLWIYLIILFNTQKYEFEGNRILIGYIDNGYGGIDKYLLTFLNSIDGKKFKIDFLTKNLNKNMKEYLNKRNCNLFEIEHNRNPIKQYIQIRKIIKEGSYETVYLNISETFNCIGVLAANSSNVKNIVVHSHSSGTEQKSKFKRKICKFLNVVCKPIIDGCSNKKVSCSKEAAKWLFTKEVIDKNEYMTIFNCIDETKFNYNEEIRNKLRIENKIENKFVIGHVGRFSYQKNHIFLLNIFKKIHDINQNAFLICIGDGEDFEEIKEYAKRINIEHSVLFTGNIKNVNEYMQVFDVFVLPSRFEGLPIVGIEAQFAGLPCVFSNKITDEVLISKNAFMSDILNEEEWVETILKINKRENLLLDSANNFKLEIQKKQFEEIFN